MDELDSIPRPYPPLSEAPMESAETPQPPIPMDGEIEPPEISENRLHKVLNAGKTTLTSAVVTAEILPVTNEGSRYGMLAASELLTHNPAVGAAVLGGSTLLVEGAGAIAAARLLTQPTGNRLFNWLNEKLEKIGPSDSKMSVPVEAGIAMTAGTPILMAAKQRERPDRTEEEARKHGLLTAAWMAGVFAVEGALISEGAGDVTDPKKIGAALLATGAIAAMPHWVRKALHKNPEGMADRVGKITKVTSVAELADSEEIAAHSAPLYESLREEQDEAVKVGLYGEDLQRVLRNPKTVLAEYEGKDGQPVHMPLLVPADELKWYNMPLLRGTYGYGKDYLYFAHPFMPPDEDSKDAIADTLRKKLEEGDIIFTDQYSGSEVNPALAQLIDESDGAYTYENIGGGDVQRTGEVFVGPANFKDTQEVKESLSINEIYGQMIAKGELSANPDNGVSLVETITGPEAERIWEIYQEPFDELSKEHPMYAGFSKEELMDILADPAVAKVVNKVEGTISTLCFFVDDFDQCPWFNKEYYQERYPEYYDTKNILIFPGIVTDPKMRGNDYALAVIDLATQLYARRDSNVLVTFECTETSAVYIPTIVEMALGHSGKGKISGIEDPISVTEYKALRKRR